MAKFKVMGGALIAALMLFVLLGCAANAQISTDWLTPMDLGIESSSAAADMCDLGLGECGGFKDQEEVAEGEDSGEHATIRGRMLYRYRYYISYGALAANRVPCPPRSGRSYYTRNCYGAGGPVRPYHRGCSRITRCYRDTQ